MSYVDIIDLGYTINIFFSIVLFIITIIISFSTDTVDYGQYIIKYNKLKSLKTKVRLKYGFLKSLRQKNFIFFIPFGFGLYVLKLIINIYTYGFWHFVHQELDESIEYYENILKED